MATLQTTVCKQEDEPPLAQQLVKQKGGGWLLPPPVRTSWTCSSAHSLRRARKASEAPTTSSVCLERRIDSSKTLQDSGNLTPRRIK